jgi:DNA recombination protein RmuC
LVSETDEKERALLERIDEMRGMEAKLKETFENLSNEALRKSTEQLMAQSKEILSRFKESDQAASKEKVLEMEKLLQPVKSELKRLEEFNRSLEQERTRETTSLKDQLAALTSGTGKLISALQGSGTAGKWGEVQLQRIVELAGMQDKVDFITQNSLDLGDGLYRPDMQVFLPGGRTMIIDAKVPVHDLDGMEAADEDGRKILAQGISNKVLDYAKGLHKRDYARLETAPDFVVMFIASESAFRMAMEGRPGLIEEAMHFNVVVASPSTLLPMLKAVNYGWRQEKLATEALNIQKLGKDIYDSLVVMKNHYDDLGRKIAAVGKAYNQFGGSLDSTVIPKARKMAEAGLPVREDQLVETAVVEFVERELRARDFAGLGTSEQPKLLE